MRLLRYWRIGLGAAALLSVGGALAADPATPYPECNRKASPADVEGAKGAHKAATQFYDRGDYDKAVRYWSDAYAFDCNAHGVLINIANSYEKMGDRASAVLALETYLKRAANPDPTVAEKVKNLKAALAPPPPTVAPTAAPTMRPTAAPSAAPTAPPPDGPRPYGWKPWIVVGGGGALAIVGFILAPVGLAAVADAEKKCPKRDCSTSNLPRNQWQSVADKGNAGRTEAGVGWALAGVGLAAAAGGLVWQFAFNKPTDVKPKTGLTTVVPVVGATHNGVLLQGAF